MMIKRKFLKYKFLILFHFEYERVIRMSNYYYGLLHSNSLYLYDRIQYPLILSFTYSTTSISELFPGIESRVGNNN